MISIKEKRILDKLKKIYEMKITNKNLNTLDDFENIKIDNSTLNNKMILKFLDSLTEEEKNYIIYHSIFYAEKNNSKFIKQILKNINTYGKNLNKFNRETLNIIILNTIYFIDQQETLLTIDSLKKFNKQFSKYFNKIEYYEINSLPTLYRNILKIILFSNDDYLKTLDEIFNTNKYDKLIIEYLNDTDINTIKKYLIRLIFFDAYILLKNELNKITIEIQNIINEFDEDSLENFILDYINYSIKNNKFEIPKNNIMKSDLYYAFLDFFLDENDKEISIKNVEEKNQKELRLLNPLYKIDDY